MSTIKRFLLLASALAFAFNVSVFATTPSCVTSAVTEALHDLVSPEARKGQTRMPALSKADEDRLIAQYKADGRPILVVTDAHAGQKSGVVTMMKVMKDEVEKMTDGKVTIKFITPDQFNPQIKVKYQDLIFSYMSSKKFQNILKEVDPQAIHVMVEGSLGKQARAYLIKHGIPFTTAYHTMFPEYIRDMIANYLKSISPGRIVLGGPINLPTPQFGLLHTIPGYVSLTQKFYDAIGKYNAWNAQAVPKFDAAVFRITPKPVRDGLIKLADGAAETGRKIANADLRNFHNASEGVMVPTQSMVELLNDGGYDADRIRFWSHGTDTELFTPGEADPTILPNVKGKIFGYAGRVAVEKGLTDFLDLPLDGTKVVIGDGPDLQALKKKYPDVIFLGRQKYEDLPKFYRRMDVFVFPSRTDTFGLVQLEANACGTPSVGYRIHGPVDIYGVDTHGVPGHKAGVLADIVPEDPAQTRENFREAVLKALTLKREDARTFAEEHTWRQSILEFMYFLRPSNGARSAP